MVSKDSYINALKEKEQCEIALSAIDNAMDALLKNPTFKNLYVHNLKKMLDNALSLISRYENEIILYKGDNDGRIGYAGSDR